MIRPIRLRLLSRNPSQSLPSLHPSPRIHLARSSSTSAALAPVAEPEEEFGEDVEPFGNAYGAGPSRIPYTRRSVSGAKMGGKLSPSEERGLSRAQKVFHTETIDRKSIAKLLSDKTCTTLLAGLDQPGHTAVVRQLSRTKSYGLAARYMLKVLNVMSTINPDRTAFPNKLVEDIFAAILRNEKSSPANTISHIKTLLGILEQLQRTRTPRSEVLYQLIIDRLCVVGQYDTAAKIYVELVEEWVMEGRVAEGADPDSFYEGGGPPREGREEWESRSAMYKTWWKGVRTWVLPGEVLSPHDRLDLWHPRKQKIPERLRRFPMPIPTSPPSIVPIPTVAHIMAILDRVELDPEKATPEAFQRSMRACAILASTILSRTIPYVPSRLLRITLYRTPVDPPVYPEHVKPPSKADDCRWAYTAHTHIHLAIRSVLLSPPAMPHMLKYMIDYDQAKTHGTSLPAPPEYLQYRTAPLGLSSVLYLMQYGLRRLRSFRAVTHVIEYARRSFGANQMTSVYNVALREASRLKSLLNGKRMARVIFGKSQLDLDAPALSPHRPHATADIPLDNINTSPESQVEDCIIEAPGPGQVPANAASLEALLESMISLRLSDKFIDAVYKLIPYLQWPPERTDPEYRALGLISERGGHRVHPNNLTPRLYSLLLRGLAEFRVVTLGRRVYRLALSAELEWRNLSVSPNDRPASERLEIEVFRSMIRLWRVEANRDLETSLRHDELWIPPEDMELMTRRHAAERMVIHTYHHARRRWMDQVPSEEAADLDQPEKHWVPDLDFFNEMILASARRWQLRKGNDWSFGMTTVVTPEFRGEISGSQIIKEVRMVVEDIRAWGFEPPLSLRIQLGEVPAWSMEDAQEGVLLASYSKIEPKVKRVVPILPVIVRSPSVDVELRSYPEDWLEMGGGSKEKSGFA